jgi:thermitase
MMKKPFFRTYRIFPLLAILLAATQAQAARKPWDRRPGVVLYQLKTNANAAQRAALTSAIGLSHASAAPSAVAQNSHLALAYTAGQRDEEDLADELMKTGAVAYAEPDYLMPMAAVPNDPGYAYQWYHGAIHSPAAWDITHGASSVIVAVCDTGVDATHPDLAANLSLPGFNSDNGTTDTTPIADHGTAVAGIIDGVGNNGTGGVGVAWNVKVLPVRVSNNSDGSAWCSSMATGIEWASTHGAKVINLSYDITGCPNTINAATDYAKTHGAVTFIAAGNTGVKLAASFPTTHSFILVGASDSSGARASFSNYGPAIDLMAPGVSIYAPLPGNTYAYGTGTSFSSPISAGVAALLFSLNASWTPDQIRILMLATAQTASATNNGYGRVDAAASVTSARAVIAGAPFPSLPGTPGVSGASSISDLANVIVYPNPWRADRHGSAIPIVFSSLTAGSTVKLFTLSGYLVRTLTSTAGKASWDLKTDSGDAAASGLYIYSITDDQNNKSQGKLSIIR